MMDACTAPARQVVGAGENERNYHVFYQLVGGADAEQRASLRLLPSCSEYLYLQVRSPAIPRDLARFSFRCQHRISNAYTR